jgi:O-6-methylguanine DNA methyltransferase
VAAKAGKPNAARAVGNILNKNPYLLVIPCHRVVRSDGRIGGFALGVKAKQRILNEERQIRELML